VLPPAYRSWGVVPAEHFIDPMMNALDRAYYVALLSAASFHGPSHHAPQVFQVMCDPPLGDRAVGRIRLRFYSGQHVLGAPIEAHTVPTGTIRVATPELTVVDMVDLPGESGGYDNIATVLGELGTVDGSSLATLAHMRGRSLARRVGWLVERFGDCDDLTHLRQVAAPGKGEPTLLRAGAARRGRVDRSWGVRVNTDVQAES
jgi:predicted transcriptional regulator of viral defense system